MRNVLLLQDLWQTNKEQRSEVYLITTRSLAAKWGAKRWGMSYYYKISGRQMRAKKWDISHNYKISGSQMRSKEARYVLLLQDLWQTNEEQRGEVCFITTRSLADKWGAKRWGMSYYYKISGRQMSSKEVRYVLLLQDLTDKWGEKRWGMSYYYKISGRQMRAKKWDISHNYKISGRQWGAKRWGICYYYKSYMVTLLPRPVQLLCLRKYWCCDFYLIF